MKDKINIKGVVTIETFDKNGELIDTQRYENAIMNEGVKKLIGILNGTVTSDIKLAYLKLGTGTTGPSDKTKTDLVTGIESKLEFTSGSIGTSFPFELNRAVTISATTISRPVTVKEMGVFFGPESGGKMFSRIVISAGFVFAANTSNVITYGLYIT